MKNRFSIIIINEKTKKNYSVSFSQIIIKAFFSLLILCIIGIMYLIIENYSYLPYEQQQQQLYLEKQNLIEMIDFLKEQNIINDSLLKNYDLLFDYKNYQGLGEIIKPVDGIITQGISNDKQNPHNGIDIATQFKNKIFAIQDGIVIFSDDIQQLGNTIIIAHPNNYYSLYGHLFKSLVQEREIIQQNQMIGTVGNGKNDEGPHLHFEIWYNNLIIDPRKLIKEYKIKDVSIR